MKNSSENKANFSKAFLMMSRKNDLSDKEAFLWINRLWRRYGDEAGLVLKEIGKQRPFLKEIVSGSGFSVGEIKYQIKNEMVTREEDILIRRNHASLDRREREAKKVKISSFL